MKLQVNNSGAWKTLITFRTEALEEVMNAVSLLGWCGRECNSNFTAQLLDEQGRMSDYWTPDSGWYTGKALVLPR